MNEHDGIRAPADTGAGAVSRRALLQQSGRSVFGLLLVSAGVGSATAASAQGLWAGDSGIPEFEAWLAVCERLDREYVQAGEAAFQRDLAMVEARYQQRLALGLQGSGDAAYRAACEQERAGLLERVHASRREWLAGRAARQEELWGQGARGIR